MTQIHRIGRWTRIVAFSIPLASLGQQGSAPPPIASTSSSGITFSATTELVTVPVVVTGKKGQHITGLKQTDFTIEEDGHPRQISAFEEVAATTSAPQPGPKPDFPLSNFASSSREHQLVTILVVDMLNTPFMYQQSAREQLVKFLESHINESGPTSLTLITSSGLRLVHSFTTEPSILVDALKRLESRIAWKDQTEPGQLGDLRSTNAFDQSLGMNPTPAQLAQAEAAALRRAISQKADADYAYYRQRDATLITLSALEQLAQSSAGIPGRKSLIWVTGGLPFLLNDPNGLTGIDSSLMSNYQRTWQALNDSNISVYPIDAHGLFAPGVNMQSSTSSSSFSANRGFPTPSRGSRRRASFQIPAGQNLLDSLRNFAQATGGEPCYNQNDLSNCVALATQDSSQYYMLSYYLPPDDRKPGWRKLKVQVSAPHHEIRARKAVYVEEAKTEDARTVEQDFDLAFSSPLDYTAVPLGLKFGDVKADDHGNRKVGFTVFLQANGFTAIDNWIRLNVHFVATDEKNKSTLVFSKMFKAHLKPDAIADLQKNGFSYSGDIDLSPGRYQLKLLVRDDLNGKFGTIAAPFLVN